jgi:hypothetical protein
MTSINHFVTILLERTTRRTLCRGDYWPQESKNRLFCGLMQNCEVRKNPREPAQTRGFRQKKSNQMSGWIPYMVVGPHPLSNPANWAPFCCQWLHQRAAETSNKTGSLSEADGRPHRELRTPVQIRVSHLNRRPQFRLLNLPQPPIGARKSASESPDSLLRPKHSWWHSHAHHLKLKFFDVATMQSCKKLQLTYKVSRCV